VQKNAGTTPSLPTSRNGGQRLSLTAPLWYEVAVVHRESCEKPLRYLKRATSALGHGYRRASASSDMFQASCVRIFCTLT
jgi:hypothetical protein